MREFADGLYLTFNSVLQNFSCIKYSLESYLNKNYHTHFNKTRTLTEEFC